MNTRAHKVCSVLSSLMVRLVSAPPAISASWPAARVASDADRADVARTLSERLGTPAPGKLDVRAVGAFRFAGNDEILYIDRTDLHSLVFERASYGRSVRPLDDRV